MSDTCIRTRAKRVRLLFRPLLVFLDFLSCSIPRDSLFSQLLCTRRHMIYGVKKNLPGGCVYLVAVLMNLRLRGRSTLCWLLRYFWFRYEVWPGIVIDYRSIRTGTLDRHKFHC